MAGFGTFVFSTFVGLWVGVVAFAQAADRFGRKTIFTASLLWYVVATVIMACQRTGEGLNIWRFIAGVGFGVQLVTIDTYLVELVPPGLRGRAFSINQCICFTAVPVVALLAWLVVPSAPLRSRRAGAGWYCSARSARSSSGDCDPAFRKARAGWLLRDASKKPIAWSAASRPAFSPSLDRCRPSARPRRRQPRAARARLADIFGGRFRRRTLMLSIFNAAQVIGFYGFNSWLPTLLGARGVDVTRGLEYAFIIAVSQPAGPLIAALFADRVERKYQIVGGLACMGLAMAGFAKASSPVLLITLGIVFTLAANIMSYAYHGYQAEIFPTRIRSRAVGFVYSWSRLAAAFAGLITGVLLADGGVDAVAGFICGAMVLAMGAIGFFGPATRGIALEQLND